MQVGHHHLVELQLSPAAVQLEDARELVNRGILDWDLVRDASQKRFVGQIVRVEVRGKHDEHIERHHKFLPRVQRQVVHAALERHNPAIEQLLGPHALAPEVVHEKYAAVRLELEWRFVELVNGVEREVEHVERQLTAHHHDRPADADPTAVARRTRDNRQRIGIVGVERFVVRGVVHRDDAAVDVDGVRNVHVPARRAPHAFGNHSLSVAGRPIEKDGLVGVDRGTELIEHALIHDKVRKAAPQPFLVDVPAHRVERLHVVHVIGEGDWRRTDVAVISEVLAGTIASQVGQCIPVRGAPGTHRTAHLHEALGARAFDERFDRAIR